MILEAVVAQQEIPKRIRKRARIILLAADGAANCTISRQLKIGRPRILHWRQRYEDQGVRGLWDIEGTAPQERIPEAVEQAIVLDCLYRNRLGLWLEWDKSLNWNVRNLARRHGVSRSTVQRIWKKYGIRMQRSRHLDQGVDVQRLKISQDPLFGITVYEIAGLYYEHANPVLALCSRERPFSELKLSDISLKERLSIADDLLSRFRKLEARALHAPWQDPDWEKFNKFVQAIHNKPRHAGAQIHLLLGTAVRFMEHPCIQMHHAPWSGLHPRWSAWVERWLKVIATWPMQASLLASAQQIGEKFRQLPRGKCLDTLIIC